MQFSKRAKQFFYSSKAVADPSALLRSAMMACVVLTLTATLQTGEAFAQDAEARKPDKDWPCKQILVREISLPAIWSGPSIEDVNWRRDAALAELVTRLAARRDANRNGGRRDRGLRQFCGTRQKVSAGRSIWGAF